MTPSAARRRPTPPSSTTCSGFSKPAAGEGAPRFLGVDAHGREVLSYLEGHVPWAPGADQAARVAADDSLVEVAGLVRQLHELTAGTPLAGPAEVVCHNDLSPRNTVYRDTGHGPRPVAFLDWDLAAPGDPAMARLRDHGAVAGVQAASAWVAGHRAELEAAVA